MAAYRNISFTVAGVRHVYCPTCFDRLHWDALKTANRASTLVPVQDDCEACGHSSKESGEPSAQLTSPAPG